MANTAEEARLQGNNLYKAKRINDGAYRDCAPLVPSESQRLPRRCTIPASQPSNASICLSSLMLFFSDILQPLKRIKLPQHLHPRIPRPSPIYPPPLSRQGTTRIVYTSAPKPSPFWRQKLRMILGSRSFSPVSRKPSSTSVGYSKQ